MSTKITEKYYFEVLSKLEKFKNAKEWSDFIEPLDSLCSVFKKYNAGYVPLAPQIVKRLNQLLNPALPGGVHIKTIECYETIFNCLTLENLVKDFDVLTIGLFNFSLSCKIIVANDYLDLLEKIITRLGSKIEPFSKHIIFAFLPFMESESSEFYSRAYLILVSFLEQISEKVFYSALWKNFIDQPGLRIPILNFLNKYKVIVITEYNLVTNAFCTGLESENSYITRSILEISNRDFPYVIESKIASNASTCDQKEIPCQEETQRLADLSISHESNQTQESIKTINDQKQENIVKDLISEMNMNLSNRSMEEIENEKYHCNSVLIKSVLKIFLKKEVGINKRAYKWLNICEAVTDDDMNYIEKGLRVYLQGSSEDILLFFRIINSLADKENLMVFLMDRLILDALQILVNIDEKKDVEVFYTIKKNAKSFLNHSLDEFYRVLYTRLDRLFSECDDMIANIDESSSDFEIENSSSESQSVYTSLSNRSTNLNKAEKILKLVVYCVESLDAVDINAKTIHIPLLCHLAIRNKKKISRDLFSYFFRIFLERCEESSGVAVQEITSVLINKFYQKESSKELLEINITASLAIELSKIEIYNPSNEDPIFWTDSNLILQNGVLLWSEITGVYRINRSMMNFFNFEISDIEILHKFVEKHSFKNFSEDFLNILGVYLAYSYKFVGLINMLKFYVDEKLIKINMWNDFIVSKNPKYLMHFDEEFLLPFIINALPVTSMCDICIFLKNALRIGKYFEILFRVTAIIDQKQSEFVDLLLTIDDVPGFLKYIFNKYYSDLDSDDPYKYNIIIPVNLIIRYLMDNENFVRSILENKHIHLDKFGEIGIQEMLTRMLFSVIIENNENKNERLGIENSDCTESVMLDYSGCIPSKDESLAKYKKISYNSAEDIQDSLRLANEGSSREIRDKINRLAFNNLYKLKIKGVPVFCSNIIEIKEIIQKNKEDFYICKRSLFLVENDVEFIYNNFMSFYKPILKQISETNIRDQFFNYISWPNTKCTVEIMLEACKYVENIKGFRNDEFFQKALCLMSEKCQKACAIYKYIRGFYRKIDKKLLFDFNVIDEEKSNKVETSKFTFKKKLHETEVLSLVGNDNLPRSMILLKCGNLDCVIQLATILFNKNPSLFVNSMPYNHSSLYLFGVLPFKVEIFKRILISLKTTKFPIDIFTISSQILPAEIKASIIRSEAEYIKNSFGFGEMNPNLMLLIIELFKNQGSSDLSKIVFLNILHILETKIESSSKASEFCDKELKILEKIIRMPIKDAQTITQIKNCCFALLLVKKHQETSLELIAKYFRKNINSKIFIDAFIGYFGNKNFFEFGILKKKKILNMLSSSCNFDQFLMMRNLIAGMETSFFMSAQSEEAIKIANLRKMSFLILSQPKNKLSSMSDSFVTMINTFISSSFEKNELKAEIIRLCTVLMFKIDNHYLRTLFPILVADFLNTIQISDLRNTRDIFKVIREIFIFVDISIWINSEIFDFKVLFLDGHHFYTKLKTEIFTDEYPEMEIDMKSATLPNFFTKVPGKITEWNQISFYLNKAPEYYGYMDSHMIERDYEAVELSLAESFGDNQ